jgi:hypothetical protein
MLRIQETLAQPCLRSLRGPKTRLGSSESSILRQKAVTRVFSVCSEEHGDPATADGEPEKQSDTITFTARGYATARPRAPETGNIVGPSLDNVAASVAPPAVPGA